jgi:hypothetical protein
MFFLDAHVANIDNLYQMTMTVACALKQSIT